MAHAPSPIRVTIVEPSLAGYRVPLFRGLAARPGIQLRLLYANSGRPNASPDGFDATEVRRRTLRLLGHPIYWQGSQWSSISRRQADVVVLDWDIHYATLFPSLLKARVLGVPTVLWGHGVGRNDQNWKSKPRHAISRLAKVLLTYTDSARQAYIGRGWSADRVFAAPNTLDQTPIHSARQEWQADPSRLELFRLQHGLNGPMLLFVSRMDSQRRVDVLLHALAQIKDEFPTLKLVQIGAGPEQENLRNLARDLDVESRVSFVGAIYEERQLAPWFLSAYALVFPSYMGLSAIHALSYGLPVVTGDDRWSHGPEVEAVRHEVNGLLFSHNDAKALAEALRRILRDETLRNQLAAGALDTAQREFSMERMIDGFEAAIRRAAAVR